MDADFCPPDIDKARMKALALRSDRAGLIRFAGHAGTLAATAILVLLSRSSLLLLLPAMAIHGAVLIFLFAPLHECIHRTAFRSRWPNETVAWVCGLLLVLPPNYFRAFHFAHHRHTQDPGRDPELAGAGRPAGRGAFLLHMTGLPYWSFQVRILIRHALGRADEAFISPTARPRIRREARAAVMIYAGIAAASAASGSSLALILWVVPALLGQPVLRAFLNAEHGLCPPVREMHLNTRTTMTAPLVRYFAWNMNYHAEHHLAPAVPFHALPQAHATLRSRLGVVSPGYAAVQREIWCAFARARSMTASPT